MERRPSVRIDFPATAHRETVRASADVLSDDSRREVFCRTSGGPLYPDEVHFLSEVVTAMEGMKRRQEDEAESRAERELRERERRKAEREA